MCCHKQLNSCHENAGKFLLIGSSMMLMMLEASFSQYYECGKLKMVAGVSTKQGLSDMCLASVLRIPEF